MKNILRITTFFSLVFALAFVLKNEFEEKPITKENDYISYLQKSSADNSGAYQKLQKQITFWEKKYLEVPSSATYKLKLANLYAKQFKARGTINDLTYSDQLLGSALRGPLLKKSPVYHALARNAITQHDFQKAKEYINKALATEEGNKITPYIQFDVLMELGKGEEANKILGEIADKNSFDYLIRLAKWQDYIGQLPAAIETMEAVALDCKNRKNEPAWIWTMSNLGDMYGHAGLLKKSYQAYLKVLEKAPDHFHSLKGIAWIAYANDKQPEDAREILDFLASQNASPSYDLLKAELYEYEGDLAKAKQLRSNFFLEAQNQNWGKMYYSDLADLNLSEFENVDETIKIARLEIANRPTGQAYLLLAKGLIEKGDLKKAKSILEERVEGTSFEPNVLFGLANCFQKLGIQHKASDYYVQSQEGSFELGPLASQEIEKALKN